MTKKKKPSNRQLPSSRAFPAVVIPPEKTGGMPAIAMKTGRNEYLLMSQGEIETFAIMKKEKDGKVTVTDALPSNLPIPSWALTSLPGLTKPTSGAFIIPATSETEADRIYMAMRDAMLTFTLPIIGVKATSTLLVREKRLPNYYILIVTANSNPNNMENNAVKEHLERNRIPYSFTSLKDAINTIMNRKTRKTEEKPKNKEKKRKNKTKHKEKQ